MTKPVMQLAISLAKLLCRVPKAASLSKRLSLSVDCGWTVEMPVGLFTGIRNLDKALQIV